MEPEVAAVARELYAVPRAEFVAARQERVRREPDGELAAAIGALRKPTAAADLLNRLARDQPRQVRELVELGERLRQPQGDLKKLSAQRHELVRALVEQARRLGREAGQPVSEPVSRELQQALAAVLVDEQAASAWQDGRLASAPQLPADAWTAQPIAWPAAVSEPAEPRPPKPDLQQRRLARAQAEAQSARQANDQAQQALSKAEADLEQASTTLTQVRQQLREAEHAEQQAAQAVRQRQHDVERTERLASEAEQRVQAAQAGLDSG